MRRFLILMFFAVFCVSVMDLEAAPRKIGANGGNLCYNGSFESTNSPLDGWTYDYAWLGNKHYMGNKNHVKTVKEGSRGNIARVGPGAKGGCKFECKPIKFEKDHRYTATFDIKGGAGSKNVRVYFIGYKWQPGVRPHDNPKIGELRNLYRSKAVTGGGSKWRTVKMSIPLPNQQLSQEAWKHLQYVRWITLYFWSRGGVIEIDNVKITKTRSVVKPLRPEATKR